MIRHISYILPPFYIAFITAIFLCIIYLQLSYYYLYLPLVMAVVAISYQIIQQARKKQVSSGIFFIVATVLGIAAHELHAIILVLIVLLIAHYINFLIEDRTQEAIESLLKRMPRKVTVVRSDGVEQSTFLETVAIGDKVLIKTGTIIPVDGVIIHGNALINEAALTGESALQEKTLKQLAYAGTFIESGSIVVQTQKVGNETIYGLMSKLIEQATQQKAPIVAYAERIGWYVTVAFIIFLIFIWLLTRDMRLMVTLLVFGAPIELTLITPLTILAAIACSFKYGILIKGGTSLEYLARSTIMAFDKTGTLTLGQPRVVDVRSYDQAIPIHDIIKLAAIAEKRSGHSIAYAVSQKASAENIPVPDPDNYISVTGHGVQITYKGDKYLVGNKHFIEAPEHGSIAIGHIIECHAMMTTLYIARNDKVCGTICIADEMRAEAQQTIAALKQAGITSMLILSGDKQEVTRHVADQLAIEIAYGNIMPEEKLRIIQDLQKQDKIVAMIGDGINDAPALKQASVGIAMGAMGMEPAINAADIVLMSNDLSLLVFVHSLSKKTLRIIKQNIIWGLFFTHALGITLGLLRLLNPLQAALFHALPETVIFLNTARLLWQKPATNLSHKSL